MNKGGTDEGKERAAEVKSHLDKIQRGGGGGGGEERELCRSFPAMLFIIIIFLIGFL